MESGTRCVLTIVALEVDSGMKGTLAAVTRVTGDKT